MGAVNSEGELPLDVATEDAMERLLKGEIKKQGEELYLLVYLLFTGGHLGHLGVSFVLFFCSSGIDVDKSRKEEERVMLQDAMAVLAGGGTLTPHPNTKATALHVASAKGYIEVLK